MTDREMLRRTADYQFGRGAGRALFEPFDGLDISRTASGRARQIRAAGERLATYGTDGRFTIGAAGARRLLEAFSSPRLRVVVGDESSPYVREGRNAFAKFVRRVDPAIRPGDEVMVVEADSDALLGVGRAELSGEGMSEFDTGMAVKIRHGVE
jgi:uncharacterized protein with predicted RNA binding PUA domain